MRRDQKLDQSVPLSQMTVSIVF